MAALISRANMRWPSSEQFIGEIYPALRQLLTGADLFSFSAIGLSGLRRLNVRLLRERAIVLSELIESRWGVTGRVGDLPDAPLWMINSTCIETGKNWRFQKREMGDWSFGKHYSPDVRLSVAAAA